MTTTVRSNGPFLSTFAGRYYYDPAIFEQEQEHIFSAMWYYACPPTMCPTPGRIVS